MGEVVDLASRFGRYGYRNVTGLLRLAGWQVNEKRMERIWKQEGLKVSKKQPKWGRLWLNDGSCIRLRPEHADHVWSYDFVHDRTHNGRPLKILTVIDEFTRECLALRVERRMTSEQVLETLAGLFVCRGVPDHIRSDNGPEFTAEIVREWFGRVGVKTLFIAPGSPWENGHKSVSDPAGRLVAPTPGRDGLIWTCRRPTGGFGRLVMAGHPLACDWCPTPAHRPHTPWESSA